MPESDQERWLTYVELGELLGISPTAARMYAKRHSWPRRTPNMYGDRARVLVPDEATVQPRSAVYGERSGYGITRDQVNLNGQDQVNVQAITSLSGALATERERVIRAEQQIAQVRAELVDANAALRETSTAHEATIADLRQRLDAAEKGSGPDPLTAIGMQTLSQAVEMLRQDVEHERDRAERQAEEGRKRIDALLIELADARTAAMITGCEAAVLRTRLELLTGPARRPWWRRWFW